MKEAQLGIRISTAKKKELDAHAAKNGLTASSLTLALIDEELRRPESLSNMYFSISKRFENVDERFEALAKGLERTLGAMEKLEVFNEKDHKKIYEILSLDGTLLKSYEVMLRSIVDYLAKLDEKSVTKAELLRILVRVLAKEEKP